MTLLQRFTILITTAVSTLVLLGAASWMLYGEFRQIGRYVEEVRSEGTRIADQYLVRVRAIDVALMQYEVRKDQASWSQFVEQSRALDTWLRQRAEYLATPEEKNALVRIHNTYVEFIERARIYEGNRFVADMFTPKRIARANLENTISNLLSLGNDLSNAHQARLAGLFKETRDALQLIAVFTVAAFMTLVGMLTWQGVELYRRYVAPLRLQVIEQSERLERQEKIASLGMLASGVAHEIRNPLAAIKARLYTLRKAVRSDVSATEDADIIQGEINRLEDIVRDFLKLARPPDPQIGPVAVDNVLAEVAELLRPDFESRGIRIEGGNATGVTAQLDREQLKQCLINLAQNGADSIDGTGTITIGSAEEDVDWEGRRRKTLCIRVADTGCGIPHDVQRRLFDPFFTTKADGTGLGLALTQRLVNGMGGRIAFQTQPGSGTTFNLYFPFDASPGNPHR
ncbi:MAG: hypothetical protein JJU00_15250 [Opitutales bacterium]|nr:hypothetical protein [Opitutales bacterium]